MPTLNYCAAQRRSERTACVYGVSSCPGPARVVRRAATKTLENRAASHVVERLVIFDDLAGYPTSSTKEFASAMPLSSSNNEKPPARRKSWLQNPCLSAASRPCMSARSREVKLRNHRDIAGHSLRVSHKFVRCCLPRFTKSVE